VRKNIALLLVALLALTMVLAAFGCGGQQAAENTTTTETSTETTMPADTAMMTDTTAMPADTMPQH
jgi:ABC-type glycerol-3-phosphate transport system substrate-binding protein